MSRGHNPMSVHESEMAAKCVRQLEDLGASGDPIQRVRLACLSRGATGILSLGRMFRRMSKRYNNKHLKEEDFVKALRENGVVVTKGEAEYIFQAFDTEHSGGINVDEVMKAIRPPMSETRKMMIEKAFQKIDVTNTGEISLNDLKRSYNIQYHPLYRSGQKSEEAIFAHFLANFAQGATKDGHVTREEFFNYYAAISASIEDDGYFDLMMRQCYKL